MAGITDQQKHSISINFKSSGFFINFLATSPAFTLRAEHPTGKQYAHYLRAVSDYCELPIVEDSNVEKISYSNNAFKLKINGTDLIESRFLVWAAGEFQFPNLNIFKGAEFCLHNSEVRSWSDLEGDEFYIIGGFESGMDAAFNLSSLGKKVNVLDRQSPWNDRDTDPSLNLSPYTLERLREEYKNGRINLFEDTDIKNIEEKTNISYTFQTAQSEVYQNSTNFEVSESVSELIIYVRVSMPDPLDLSQQIRELIYDTTGVNVSTLSQEARYVHVKIKNPNGEIFYEKLASESIEPVVEVHRPPLTPGTWILEVEARGYGFNIFEVVEAEDNFAAIITVTSECVKFSEEDCQIEE